MSKKATSPIPEGMNTVTPQLIFNGDCDKALALYPKAFGAKLVYEADKAPDGKIMHAMIKIGDSNIMLADNFSNPDTVSKSDLWLYVEDCDDLYGKAVKAGCSVTMPMADAFWGDRLGQVRDPFGHTWNIASRKLVLTPDEMKERETEWIDSSKESYTPV